MDKKRLGPPDTLDLKGLTDIARKIAGFVGNVFSAPAASKAQEPLLNPYISSGNIPTQTTSITPEKVQQGFLKYDANSPLATQSAVISQALDSLSPKIDPKLILSKMIAETRGGKDLVGRQEGLNNPLNTMYQGKLVNYPDLKTALSGGPNPLEGNPSQGAINILNGPLYEKYRQSQNLKDFFDTYSPSGSGNPTTNTQIQQALEYMKYWQ